MVELKSAAHILIADDEPFYRDTTAELLREEGFRCTCVEDADDAISQLKENRFDLVLTDLNMPGNLKLELLRHGRGHYAETPMIVVTGVPSIPSAIESVKLGISDYLLKPVKIEDLLAAVRRALAQNLNTPSLQSAGPTAQSSRRGESPGVSGMIGECDQMRHVMDIVEKVSVSPSSVLITGESGTGKEVIASEIHRRSPRQEATFQVIDCTAIPESLFESVMYGHVEGAFTGAVKDQQGLLRSCDGGTAFLDELGELPMSSQAKLLRVIQDQTFTPVGGNQSVKVDVRFVSATNRDLLAEVAAGNFRKDLFYRLAVIQIELPPLRERGEDVVLLARYFLARLLPDDRAGVEFSQEVLDAFREYHWPGNIRELRNVVERSVALVQSGQIESSDLPNQLKEKDSLDNPPSDELSLTEVSRDTALDHADREYLAGLLEKHNGVIASAARQAGLSRQGMTKLLKRHKINANEFRK